MKYLLINKTTKEEHLCSKVTIGKFDYYVIDNIKTYLIDPGVVYFSIEENPRRVIKHTKHISGFLGRVIIATNDSSSDIPQVINENISVSDLALKSIGIYQEEVPHWEDFISDKDFHVVRGFKKGYEKSQESHPYTLQDMVDFAKWIADSNKHGYVKQLYETLIIHKKDQVEDILGVWEKQKIKTIYYA